MAGEPAPHGSNGDIIYPRKPRLVLLRTLNSSLMWNVSVSVFHCKPKEWPMAGVAIELSSGAKSTVFGRGVALGNWLLMTSQLVCILVRFKSYLRKSSQIESSILMSSLVCSRLVCSSLLKSS